MAKEKKDIIFVELPEKTTDAYVALIFRFGYYDESDRQFGFSHLFEHYVADRVKERTRNIEIQGSVGDTDFRFEMKTKKRKLLSQVTALLDTFYEDTVDDAHLLNIERARIRSEMNEKDMQFETWLRGELIQMLVKGPRFARRTRGAQVKNTDRATLRDIEKLRVHLAEDAYPILVVGASGLSAKDKNGIKRLFEKHDTGKVFKQPKRDTVQYKQSARRTIRHKTIVPDHEHATFLFPALALHGSLPDRIALGIFCRLLWQRVESALGVHGVYRVNYEYFIGSVFGYVRFFAYVPQGVSGIFESVLFEELQKLLSDKDLERRLSKILRERKGSLRRMWQSNGGRMEWIEDDMADYGFVYSLAEAKDAIDAINLRRMRLIAKKVLNKKNMFALRVLHDK